MPTFYQDVHDMAMDVTEYDASREYTWLYTSGAEYGKRRAFERLDVDELADEITGSHFIEHQPGSGEHLNISPQAARFLLEKLLTEMKAQE